MTHTPSYVVLIVHAVIALALIVDGAVLVGLGSIGQDTYLAMVSGALGLIGGGGAAIALHNSMLSAVAKPPQDG